MVLMIFQRKYQYVIASWTHIVFVFQLSLCIDLLFYYSDSYSRKKYNCGEQNKYSILINTYTFELLISLKWYFLFIFTYKYFLNVQTQCIYAKNLCKSF